MHDERVVALLGATGSGKTHKLAQLIRNESRVILCDPKRDNKNFGTWGVQVETMAEAVARTQSNNFHIRWSGDRSPLMFESLCWLALEREDVVLAIDEIQFFVRKSALSIPKYFQECCLGGRHERVFVYCTSQRPALTHNDFLSQVSKWYLFKMHFPGDVDAVKGMIPNAEASLTFSKVGQYLTFPDDKHNSGARIVVP